MFSLDSQLGRDMQLKLGKSHPPHSTGTAKGRAGVPGPQETPPVPGHTEPLQGRASLPSPGPRFHWCRCGTAQPLQQFLSKGMCGGHTNYSPISLMAKCDIAHRDLFGGGFRNYLFKSVPSCVNKLLEAVPHSPQCCSAAPLALQRAGL